MSLSVHKQLITHRFSLWYTVKFPSKPDHKLASLCSLDRALIKTILRYTCIQDVTALERPT